MSLFTRLYRGALLLLSFMVAAQSLATTPADIVIDREGVLLRGKFHAAEGEGSFPTAVVLSGLPGNENDVLGLGNKLSDSGINALTFNYSSTHQSQG